MLVKGGAALRSAADDAEAFGATFDEAERRVADFADSALDRLGLALEGLKNKSALAFAPFLTEAATGLSDLVRENLPRIKEFAEYLGRQATQLVKDFFNAVKGNDAAVVNKSLLTIRDTAVAIGEGFKIAVEGVIIPAFKALEGAANGVAAVINGVFGTELNGRALLAGAIILKVIGVFRIFGAAIRTLFTLGRGFAIFFGNIGNLARGLSAILLGLGPALKALAVGVTALVAANPVIATLVIAAAGLAAGVVYLATRQTEAEKAAAAHAKALEGLKQIQQEVDAGIPGATQNLEAYKEAQLAAGKAAIANAEAQFILAQQNLDALVFETGQYGEEWVQNSAEIKRAASAVNEQREALRRVKLEYTEIVGGISLAEQAARKLADANAELANETARAAGETQKIEDGYKRILVKGPDGFERAFDVPTEKFLEAQREIKKLEDALKQPLSGNTVLDEATQKARRFLADMEGVVREYEGIIGRLAGKGAEIRNAFNGAFDGLSEVFISVGNNIAESWESSMSRIVNSTQSMAADVTSLISGLSSRLETLIRSISRAKSSSGGSSDGDGFASGGYISGSGTGTSDSIAAWLSNGEFVIRASAVRKYGAAFFAALNGMRLSDAVMPKFAMGGLVGMPSMPMPSMALGSARPASSLTLVLDGQSFGGLIGPSETISQLEMAVKTRRIRSTGRASPYATR